MLFLLRSLYVLSLFFLSLIFIMCLLFPWLSNAPVTKRIPTSLQPFLCPLQHLSFPCSVSSPTASSHVLVCVSFLSTSNPLLFLCIPLFGPHYCLAECDCQWVSFRSHHSHIIVVCASRFPFVWVLATSAEATTAIK